MVDYNTKKDSLFLETVVLINGETNPEKYADSDGDYFTKEDIRRMYTNEANTSNHDVEHNIAKEDGVKTIANYISTMPEEIAEQEIPEGSWRKDIIVTDPEIIQKIKDNEITGVSIHGALKGCSQCYPEAGKSFQEVNKECVQPVFISLVESPANMVGMNVYSYDTYLTKCVDGNQINNNITKKNNSGENKIMTSKSKFGEMLKSFGESVVNYSESLNQKSENNIAKADGDNPTDDKELTDQEKLIEEVKKVIAEEVAKLDERITKIEEAINEKPPEENEESTQKSIKMKPIKNDETIEPSLEKTEKKQKVNRFGFPIKSSKEIMASKNQFRL
jgi:hypothetical protein